MRHKLIVNKIQNRQCGGCTEKIKISKYINKNLNDKYIKKRKHKSPEEKQSAPQNKDIRQVR